MLTFNPDFIEHTLRITEADARMRLFWTCPECGNRNKHNFTLESESPIATCEECQTEGYLKVNILVEYVPKARRG